MVNRIVKNHSEFLKNSPYSIRSDAILSNITINTLAVIAMIKVTSKNLPHLVSAPKMTTKSFFANLYQVPIYQCQTFYTGFRPSNLSSRVSFHITTSGTFAIKSEVSPSIITDSILSP